MSRAIKEHHVTLETTDEHTYRLSEMIHGMRKWLENDLITKDTYVHIHNILRENLGTENFLLITGFRDNREEENKYTIRVIEFPEKADGTIRDATFNKEEQVYYLLGKKEVVFEDVVYLSGKHADTIEKLRNLEISGSHVDVEDVIDCISLYVQRLLGKSDLLDHNLKVSYEKRDELVGYETVLVTLTKVAGGK